MQVGRKVKHNVDEASKNNLCVDWEAEITCLLLLRIKVWLTTFLIQKLGGELASY